MPTALQSVQEASARAVGSMLSGLLSRYPTNQHDACTDVYTLGAAGSNRMPLSGVLWSFVLIWGGCVWPWHRAQTLRGANPHVLDFFPASQY